MKHAYLLHTGYGKTKLCLDKMVKASRIPRTLLISTKKIVESSWDAEIEKWYPGQISYSYITGDIKPKKRLEIVNNPTDMLGISTSMLDWYISNTCSVKRKSLLKSGKMKLYYDTDELLPRFDLIIIDESSLFKNSQSNRFKALKKWVSKMPNVLILSATPTPKNIEDLWAQIYLLDGGKRLGKNITAFRQAWGMAVPLPNGHNRYDYTQEAINDILNNVKDIVTSVPAPEQPLFPEPNIIKSVLKPDPATEKMLREFKEDFIIRLTNGKDLKAFTINQLMIKINQMASGAVYYKDTTVHLNDIKFKAVEYMASQITTPIMILYVYKFDKEKLLTLPGAKLLETPQDMRDWNDNKIKIGILSPFSAAHGLNLQDSDCVDVWWFSPIWDTEKWIQTNARVCRRGQKNVVTIRVFIMKHSYDDHMFDLCQEKFRVQFNNLHKLKGPANA